ncbi:MAG: response regulator [Candidatus Margulisbacteria bacterium]|nr:response regulator [Candidatus Margulisiibacteriota bacterium]
MAKILVVDDASFMRIKIANMLKKSGHEIIQAENGQIAVEKYKSDSPQIVFMDITMPVKNGIEALKEIIDFDKSAKVIMLSNEAQQERIMEAIQCGAKKFIAKPFDDEKIISCLNELL